MHSKDYDRLSELTTIQKTVTEKHTFTYRGIECKLYHLEDDDSSSSVDIEFG